MTREEAKAFLAEICYAYQLGKVNKMVNKIYDDFEQERREQADIRNKRKCSYEMNIKKVAKESAEKKYKAMIHRRDTANKSVVYENKRLRKLLKEEEEPSILVLKV